MTDPTNGATLYLGSAELHAPTTGPVTGTRSYTTPGIGLVAERTAVTGSGTATVVFCDADPQGTNNAYLDTSDNTVVRRYSEPFGDTRGPSAVWPTSHGFLNAPKDALTTTTHLGAREYDPTLGRFLSVDPLLDIHDPQSINSYGCADNNPATNTDPTGTICVNNQGDPVPCGSKGTTRNNPVPTPAGPPPVGPPASGPEPSGGGNGSEHSGGQTQMPCDWLCQVRKSTPSTGGLLQVKPPPPPAPVHKPRPAKLPKSDDNDNDNDCHGLWGCTWSATKSAGRWAWDNRAAIATGIATASCFSAVATVLCGATQAAAFAMRAQDRGVDHFQDHLVDAGVTLASLGIGHYGGTPAGKLGVTGGGLLLINTSLNLPGVIQTGACFAGLPC